MRIFFQNLNSFFASLSPFRFFQFSEISEKCWKQRWWIFQNYDIVFARYDVNGTWRALKWLVACHTKYTLSMQHITSWSCGPKKQLCAMLRGVTCRLNSLKDNIHMSFRCKCNCRHQKFYCVTFVYRYHVTVKLIIACVVPMLLNWSHICMIARYCRTVVHLEVI